MQNPAIRRRRVLLIGSGYRVRNSFLPALSLLDSDVEIVGVHSRDPARAREAGAPFGVNVIADLRVLQPDDVDAVMVSVTPTSNLDVLRATSHIAPDADLVMDTPAALRWVDLRQLALYRRWRRVRVAEDFMNLPQFRLVGKVIESGAIGDVVRIRVENMGYRYHALALLRSWLGFPLTESARSRRSRHGAVNIVYRFRGGVTGEVIEPFTGADGPFQVIGTRGSITGHSMGYATNDVTTGHAIGHLERLEDNGLSGFQVVGLGADMATNVASLARLRDMPVEDDSEFNLLRVQGLLQVISSLWSPDPMNAEYRVQDAMADALVSFASRAFPWWSIPRRTDRNVVDLLAPAFRRVRS